MWRSALIHSSAYLSRHTPPRPKKPYSDRAVSYCKIDILRRALAATRAVETFQYQGEAILLAPPRHPDPDAEETIATGDVILKRFPLTQQMRAQKNGMLKDMPAQFRLDMDVKGFSELRGAQQHVYDGETYHVLYEPQKLLIHVPGGEEGPPPPAAFAVHQLIWKQFYNPDSLDPDSIMAYYKEPITYAGTADVAGVRCHIIRAGPVYAWYIGVDDYLPRRRDGNFIYNILSDLEVTPTLLPAPFSVTIPAHYSYRIYEENASFTLSQGMPTPDWTLVDGAGRSHILSAYRGQVVVLDFWASWCGPCRDVTAIIERVQERFEPEDVMVFGVNLWEDRFWDDPSSSPNLDELRTAYGGTSPMLLKGDDVALQYGVSYIPKVFVIGREGTVLYESKGDTSMLEEELINLIKMHLQE